MLAYIFLSNQEKSFYKKVYQLTKIRPKNLNYYKLAFTHRSVLSSKKEAITKSNERLEYLGDAALSIVLAEYLYKKHTEQDVGFLTDTRSKVVNRKFLNTLAAKINLNQFLEIDEYMAKNPARLKNVYGNALEALIGAIYLDYNLKTARKFILKQLIEQYVNWEQINQSIFDYKSELINLSTKRRFPSVEFKILDVNGLDHEKRFTAGVYMAGFQLSTGVGRSKKESEKDAAKHAYEKLFC